MGQIRKQVIQSSFLTYVGFLVGAINTYFFTKKGLFTPAEYGLTQVIISMSQVIAPFATLGMTGFMNRFFPYYMSHLEKKHNDMLTVAVVVSGIGAIIVFTLCIVFEPLLLRHFSQGSAMVVEFYYWTLLFTFFYLTFLILESYLTSLKLSVIPGFMKETVFRSSVLLLIGLYAFKVIDYHTFVILFCCIYLLIVCIILVYLSVTRQLFMAFRFSKVTRKHRKNITTYVSYVYTAVVVNGMARQIDTLILAGVRSLQDAGIYSLGQYMAATLQVPQRGLLAIAGPMIAEHWKNKNYPEIRRIYERASINLLLIGTFLFGNMWLNYDAGLDFLGLDPKYHAGKTAFLILSTSNIIDLTIGVTGAVIITSPLWRFEFFCSVVLLALSLPLNILLTSWKGMEGTALAILITFVVYNLIRLIFIKRKLNMWPFSLKTAYALLLVSGSYVITWLLFRQVPGLGGILLRFFLFSGLFFAGVFYFRLTPDLFQVIAVVKKRIAGKK